MTADGSQSSGSDDSATNTTTTTGNSTVTDSSPSSSNPSDDNTTTTTVAASSQSVSAPPLNFTGSEDHASTCPGGYVVHSFTVMVYATGCDVASDFSACAVPIKTAVDTIAGLGDDYTAEVAEVKVYNDGIVTGNWDGSAPPKITVSGGGSTGTPGTTGNSGTATT